MRRWRFCSFIRSIQWHFLFGCRTGNFRLRPAFSNMPLFFFDVRFDERTLTDEGLWYPNLKQAELEAQGAAEEIIRKLGSRKVTVTIRDQHKVVQKKIIVPDWKKIRNDRPGVD